MLSITSNYETLIAIQALRRTNNDLRAVDRQIATGLKVGSPKDDGAIWSIAQQQRSEIASLNVVKGSLVRGQSATDVAIAAGENVVGILSQMKAKALAASDTSLTNNERSALNDDFVALKEELAALVTMAEFDGINLIEDNAVDFSAIANTSGVGKITVKAQDLSLGGPNVTVSATASMNNAPQASSMINTVEQSIQNVTKAVARLGTGHSALTRHFDFVSKLQDTMEAGVSHLVDADLTKAASLREALLARQEMGVQSLSIANRMPTLLASLFRD